MYKSTVLSPISKLMLLISVLLSVYGVNAADVIASKSVSGNPNLPNFHEVHPYLFRGGEPTVDGLKDLKQRGIGTIIDLRAMSPITAKEKAITEQLGMKYINLPMSNRAPSASQVHTFLSTVEKATLMGKSSANEASGPVFVHCAHGSDRTGCMVGIWRVLKDDWSYDQAYAEMRKYYFGPQYKELSGIVKRYAGWHHI